MLLMRSLRFVSYFTQIRNLIIDPIFCISFYLFLRKPALSSTIGCSNKIFDPTKFFIRNIWYFTEISMSTRSSQKIIDSSTTLTILFYYE